MVTILRTAGLTIHIYRDDHDPPHVHVVGDGETKIELGDGPNTMTVVFWTRAKKSERRRAFRAVRDNHAFLRKRWSDLHD